MNIDKLNISGSKSGTVALADSVFLVNPNKAVVRQAVLAEMTNLRQGTHSTKNRSAVSGGGKKPFKQKGRGGARAGTIRSPLWKGGGTIFGPEPHPYKHKLPKKVGVLARKSVLSSKLKLNEIMVVDKFLFASHKTSDLTKFLVNLKIQNKKITILISEYNENLDFASRNLKDVYVVISRKASSYDLIDCDILLFDEVSLGILSKTLEA